MSYYNYHTLFPPGQAHDRVRGVRLPAEGPQLTTLDEAFTSENWIIRIYRVKEPDNVGRDHASAVAFERSGGKRKRRTPTTPTTGGAGGTTGKRRSRMVLRME